MPIAVRGAPRRSRRVASAVPFLVATVGLAGSIVAWRSLEHIDDRLDRDRLEVEVEERVSAIEQRLDETEGALEDLAAILPAPEGASAEEFRRFVAPILARRPALRAISWNPLVAHRDRASHEAAMQQSGALGYQIVELDARGQLVPARVRPDYVVVELIEPVTDNAPAIGFDVASEQRRRQALDEARDSGRFVVATPIALVQGDGESHAALGFLPRYRPGAPVASVEQRRDAILGYFVSVVDLSTTLGTALANFDLDELDVHVTTAAVGDQAPELLYPTETGGAGGDGPAGLRRDDESAPALARPLEWGGNDLVVEFRPRAGLAPAFNGLVPVSALLAGLTLTALGTAYVHSARRRTIRIESEVIERTHELQTANRWLEAEMERRQEAEKQLVAYRDDLEAQVRDRTAALEYASTQLRAILDSEPECVKLVSGEGQLVEMNPAGLRMIEADSIEQVRGLNVYDLIAPENRQDFVDLNARVMRGESATLEFAIEGLRGTRRFVETHAVPFTVAPGEPPLHLAITRDVTTRRAAETERAKLEAQLRHAQKLESIGVLAGGIAHDFNNILHVIRNNTDIALGAVGDDPGVRRALESSRLAADEAAKLCDQMLTYAGESQPDVRPVSMSHIVGSMLELLEVSHTKKVGLTLDGPEDGVCDVVEADGTQLGQVVMNLVTNAAEAMGDQVGTIGVAVRSLEGSAATTDEGRWLDAPPDSGRFVVLEVSDSGCGIGADEIDQIFDPFYTTKFTGRGLGLSSTLGIVRAHRGHLQVVSAVGRGTTIRVLFPTSDRPTSSSPEPDADGAIRFEGTILVVDDVPEIADVVRQLLELMGLRVLTAADGQAALTLFSEHHDEIDVALLDLTMPVLDGLETSRAMRVTRPDLPIIFCSGYAADAARSLGADGDAFTAFLHKPFSRSDLVDALTEADRRAHWSGRGRRVGSYPG